MNGLQYVCDGRPLQLGARIGAGGEGSVFMVAPGAVAKLYADRPGPSAQKVSALLSIGDAAARAVAAWPERLVFATDGSFAGFVMPHAEGFASIASAANPAARKRTFPQAGWGWLAHTGRNLAVALDALHAAGIVVGDLNESNVLVASDARVRLIDADSFQLRSGDAFFSCDVGTPMYQPPELQGRPFAGLVRTANHDRFGLAVLVFQLLFMGRHPWAGLRSGKAELSFEDGEYIATLPFAYGADARRTRFEPPDDAVSMEWLPAPLQELFERAFAKGSLEARPAGEEWARQLDAFKTALVRCATVRTHDYPRSLAACPWCRFDRRGIMYFIVGTVALTRESLDIAEIEEQLRQIAPPQALPALAVHAKAVGEPLDAGLVRRVQLWRGEIAGSALAAFAASHWLAFAWAMSVVLILVAAVVFSRPPLGRVRTARRERLEAAQRRYSAARDAYGVLLAESDVEGRKRELLTLLTRYKELPAKYQAERQALERDRQRLQLEEFLEHVLVRDAAPWRIGRKTRATLAAYGIVTAKDVLLRLPHTDVPGVGERKRERLAGWVVGSQRTFRFDPHKPLDPALLYALARREQEERSTLERTLRGAPAALRRHAGAVAANAVTARAEMEEAGGALLQADADWDVLQWL